MRATPVVLVEGACGAGKSALISAITRIASDRGTPARAFSQRETYAPIARNEDAGTLNDTLNLAILTRVVESIERAAHEAAPGSLVLIDTLHLTQLIRPAVLSLASFDLIERRLAPLLTLTVFLRALPATLRARAIDARRGSDFLRYIQRFARGDDALVDYFVATQQRMLEALDTRCLSPHLVLDSEAPVQELATSVLIKLGATARTPRPLSSAG